MKSVVGCIFAYVILTSRLSQCAYRVSLTNTPPSALTLLANDILSKLVSSNVFDGQVAKNLLQTFDMVGVGAFADLQNAVAYTSKPNIAFGGNQTAAGNTFLQLLSQLIPSVNSTACASDRHGSFVEILLKLALELKVLDGKADMALAANYNIMFELNLEGELSDEECFQKQFNFQRFCTTQYGGVADGARCFFLIPTVQNWYESWAACSLKGASLAQIQTSSEYKKISTFPISHMWLAGRRTKDANEGCRVSVGATYWYDDPQTFNPKLVLNNTFIRSRRCDYGPYDSNQHCIGFTLEKKIHATACTDASSPIYAGHLPRALCQISSPDQQYVLISEICLGETPIETFTISLKACHEQCRLRRWCRSFNYINNSECQLFTWSVDDQPKLMTVNGNGTTCDHYTYVP